VACETMPRVGGASSFVVINDVIIILKAHDRMFLAGIPGMDDRLQLNAAREMAESEPLPPDVSVFYDSSTESCDLDFRKQNGVLESDAHLLGSSSAVDSESGVDRSELLREKHKKSKLQFLCPSCYDHFSSYRSSNPEERVTPFALVLLLVLFMVYVLNQADRLVLPVVIPDGLRCELSFNDECANRSNNSMSDGSASGFTPITFRNETNLSNATDVVSDCIDFNDDEQGLLTGG